MDLNPSKNPFPMWDKVSCEPGVVLDVTFLSVHLGLEHWKSFTISLLSAMFVNSNITCINMYRLLYVSNRNYDLFFPLVFSPSDCISKGKQTDSFMSFNLTKSILPIFSQLTIPRGWTKENDTWPILAPFPAVSFGANNT